MIILGIETSCDETAISVVRAEGEIEAPVFEVLGSSIQSQIDIHKEYGGVFPTLAKREHIRNLPIVYAEALKKSGVSEEQIDVIAVTVGPGLEPALWTGINFAKDLGIRCGKAVIPTNHMVGHIASVLLDKKVEFPAIALLVSGGHTELVLLNNWVDKKKLGETLDDAVGEAFDKVARMLGLPYPGGPEISKLAEEARIQNISLEKKFPRPMMHSGDFNFSFSGLKTAVLYYLRDLTSLPTMDPLPSGIPSPDQGLPAMPARQAGEGSKGGVSFQTKLAVAREFEDAVIETLLSKTQKAIDEYSPKSLIIGGGVIANKALRENFLKLKEKYSELEIFVPEKELTTDNATMIAMAGYIEYLQDKTKIPAKLEACGYLEI